MTALRLIKKFEVFRLAHSLNIIDNIADTLSRIYQIAKENGLTPKKVQFSPWQLAKYSKTEKRLFLHLWGSPEELETNSKVALASLEARLSTELEGVGENYKRALADAICETAIEQEGLKQKIRYAIIGANEEIEFLQSVILEAKEDIGLKEVFKIAKKSTSVPNPDEYITKSIRKRSKNVQRFYTEYEKIQMREFFAGIPAEQVKKPEFALVLAKKGNVNLRELRSVYSFLMALVLKRPGEQLGFYHNQRSVIRKDFVTLQATAGELTHLIDFGFIVRKVHKYYSASSDDSRLEKFFE